MRPGGGFIAGLTGAAQTGSGQTYLFRTFAGNGAGFSVQGGVHYGPLAGAKQGYIDGLSDCPTFMTGVSLFDVAAGYADEDKFVYAGPNGGLNVGQRQVLGIRRTGWSADTGTAKRPTNATYPGGSASPSYDSSQMGALMDAVRDQSETLKALKDDLIAHGLIGS